MEDITKKKQGYLRTEIIEGGFDPGQFVEFLASQRENGEDVEVWSMQSLEDMVERFKEQHADTNAQTDDQEPENNDEFIKTPEKVHETPAQLSAKAQSFRGSHIKDDSEDEDERAIQQAERVFAQRSTAKDENQLAEDYIRKSVIDTKEAQAATRAAGLMSEGEKQKKELLDKALQDKKSTIVLSIH